MPFDSPNYTQMPNDLLGDWSKPSLMSEMSECELKVVLAICRLTFGYHRRRVRAALPILIEMTGLSKQGVINGTKAAEKRGLIQRVSQPGRGKIATWEVITTEKVNDLDLFRNGQNNGPFEAEKVNDLDSKGQQSRHMKESSKEIDSKEEKAPSDFGIGQADPLEGVPPATDNHQRKVDEANGGNGADPVSFVMEHHYYGFREGPAPLPDKKKDKGEFEKWRQTSDYILRHLPEPWDLPRIGQAIDEVWRDGWDKFYERVPCKEEGASLFVNALRAKLAKSTEPQTADPGPLPDFVTS